MLKVLIVCKSHVNVNTSRIKHHMVVDFVTKDSLYSSHGYVLSHPWFKRDRKEGMSETVLIFAIQLGADSEMTYFTYKKNLSTCVKSVTSTTQSPRTAQLTQLAQAVLSNNDACNYIKITIASQLEGG